MNNRIWLVVSSLLLSVQFANAQASDSYVTVSISKNGFKTAGAVSDDTTRSDLIRSIEKQCGSGDHSRIRIVPGLRPFVGYWNREVEALLTDCKTRRPGMIRYQRRKAPAAGNPALSRAVLDTRLLTRDGTDHKLSELIHGVTVIHFFEPWSPPSRLLIPQFNELAASNKDLRVVSISTDPAMTDVAELWKFAGMFPMAFTVARADIGLFEDFANISGSYDAIPQTFVIVDGRVRAHFVGSSDKSDKAMRNLILDVLKGGKR